MSGREQVAELYKAGVPLKEIARRTDYALPTVKDYLRVMRAEGLIGGRRVQPRSQPQPQPRLSRQEQRRREVTALLASVPGSEWPARTPRLAYLLYGEASEQATEQARALVADGVRLGMLTRSGRTVYPAPLPALAS